jgi:hypothetical protein
MFATTLYQNNKTSSGLFFHRHAHDSRPNPTYNPQQIIKTKNHLNCTRRNPIIMPYLCNAFVLLTMTALYMPNTLAQFDEDACVSCVGGTSGISLRMTYCEMTDGTYECFSDDYDSTTTTTNFCPGIYYSYE